MPTYEYECLECGEAFEKFQKMSDSPLKECPKCKGKVKKLISSGSGLIFKGSGFYSTDYRKTAAAASNKKTQPADCASCKEAPKCSQANKP